MSTIVAMSEEYISDRRLNNGFLNDVFDVEPSQRRIILMQMTILASVSSALANLSPDL